MDNLPFLVPQIADRIPQERATKIKILDKRINGRLNFATSAGKCSLFYVLDDWQSEKNPWPLYFSAYLQRKRKLQSIEGKLLAHFEKGLYQLTWIRNYKDGLRSVKISAIVKEQKVASHAIEIQKNIPKGSAVFFCRPWVEKSLSHLDEKSENDPSWSCSPSHRCLSLTRTTWTKQPKSGHGLGPEMPLLRQYWNFRCAALYRKGLFCIKEWNLISWIELNWLWLDWTKEFLVLTGRSRRSSRRQYWGSKLAPWQERWVLEDCKKKILRIPVNNNKIREAV
jgi:hypothetical protein